MDERRKAPRFKIGQAVVMEFPKETFIQVEGINLSARGMLCFYKEELAVYTRLFLILSIPYKGKEIEVKCEGIIMRVDKVKKGFNYGVEIVDVDPEQEDDFKEYLKSLAS